MKLRSSSALLPTKRPHKPQHEDGFSVAIIPHTQEVTTLGCKGPGDLVNLELDVIAKYVESLLGGHTPEGNPQ